MSLPNEIKKIYESAECLYTTNEVEAALDQMGKKIHGILHDKNPILLCVMIGGLVPTGNLLPRLDFPLEVDYIHATRYQGERNGSELIWKVKPKVNLQGRTVLLVDDILDGGVTLAAIIAEINKMGAKEVYTAVLVDKRANRDADGLQNADVVGIEVQDHFIFGYGMDYKEYLRNAPGIFIVKD